MGAHPGFQRMQPAQFVADAEVWEGIQPWVRQLLLEVVHDQSDGAGGPYLPAVCRDPIDYGCLRWDELSRQEQLMVSGYAQILGEALGRAASLCRSVH